MAITTCLYPVDGKACGREVIARKLCSEHYNRVHDHIGPDRSYESWDDAAAKLKLPIGGVRRKTGGRKAKPKAGTAAPIAAPIAKAKPDRVAGIKGVRGALRGKLPKGDAMGGAMGGAIQALQAKLRALAIAKEAVDRLAAEIAADAAAFAGAPAA